MYVNFFEYLHTEIKKEVGLSKSKNTVKMALFSIQKFLHKVV